MPRLNTYTEAQKKEIKAISNSYNYLRTKQLNGTYTAKTKKEIKQEFVNGMTSVKSSPFDTYLTLTIDPKLIGKRNWVKQLKEDELREQLTDFPDLINYLGEAGTKRCSIEFINNIGTSFFNFLFERKIITNVLSALEKDKSGRWHIHALVTSNTNYIAPFWFYGRSKVIPVGYGLTDDQEELEDHRKTIIEYMFDTYNPSSTSHVQQKRMDYWYLHEFKPQPEVAEKASNTCIDSVYTSLVSGELKSNPMLRDDIKIEIIRNPERLAKALKLSPMALFFLITAILLLL